MQKVDIFDYHLHSKYSIPSSSEMDVFNMVRFARLKGITILGTGDILLPQWRKELQANFSDFSSSFYYFDDFPFVLTSEVNLIFEKEGQTKKFHVVLAFPTFVEVDEFEKAFKNIAHFSTSARPNIHIEPSKFVKLVLNINPNIQIILAHIFTPHYGVLGASNGFSNLESLFESDISSFVFLETGLSADPKMVYSVESLKNYHVISSSDAHSPKYIGREAVAVEGAFNFYELFSNLKDVHRIFTLESFPQLGKYYLDGHRHCKYRSDDLSVSICPVCGKKLTKGVLHRVQELSLHKDTTSTPPLRYFYIIPLVDILYKSYGKKSDYVYNRLISEFHSELNVLLNASLEDLRYIVDDNTIFTIKSMREGNLHFDCGYDGVYGDWRAMIA